MSERFEIEAALTRDEALEALAQASELWGAGWERQGDGGRLALPVLTGLKRGLLVGPVQIEAAASGSRLVFDVEERHDSLNWTAVAILVFGAAGGIAATLWPFFPVLLGVAPLAVVVAIGAWILVASRLRTSTPEDFLDLVADHGAVEEEPPPLRAVDP